MIPNPEIIHGDCVEKMKQMAENSISAIICDPPYGIGMSMGKGWDKTVPALPWAEQCFRVLKPGGHIIAFGANRTIHRLACALEDAGFDIRDQLGWVTWSSFPKSMNIGKALDRRNGVEREIVGIDPHYSPGRKIKGFSPLAPTQEKRKHITAPSSEEAQKWEGWGTNLKSCIEPAILARKPISEKTIIDNILRWGTGALNIEKTRMRTGDPMWIGPSGDVSKEWDKQISTNISSKGSKYTVQTKQHRVDLSAYKPSGRWPPNLLYCPKVSRKERDLGCEHLPIWTGSDQTGREEGSAGIENPRAGSGRTGGIRNHHPTLKPIALLRWMVKLLAVPDGKILDTFAGSGSTLMACILEGVDCVGIELEDSYIPIIEARTQWAKEQRFRDTRQLSLFGGLS